MSFPGGFGKKNVRETAVPYAKLSVGTIRLFGFHRHISLVEEISFHIKHFDQVGSIGETIYETGDIEITDAIAGKALVILENIETVTGLFHFHLDVGTTVVADVGMYHPDGVVERAQDDGTASGDFSYLTPFFFAVALKGFSRKGQTLCGGISFTAADDRQQKRKQ